MDAAEIVVRDSKARLMEEEMNTNGEDDDRLHSTATVSTRPPHVIVAPV